jgi:hypothetical protein
MTPSAPPPEAGPSVPAAPTLIFDWRHRPRTWLKLTFWLMLVLVAHLAGFVLFSVRTPPPARAMPVPASLVLAPAEATDSAETAGRTPLTGLPSPAETADLELPEQTPAEPHRPTFADHAIARQPWPSRPERAAWPEVSGVSRPVLPPASPAPPSERPADPPR